jgi:hypothetical protein
MKFSKKRGQYEASNVSFNAETLEAFSYSWWKFVSVVNGVLVFNNYYYSSSTGKHQRKVRNLLETLGIKPQLVIRRSNKSLGVDSLQEEIISTKAEIKEIKAILANPRRRKSLDDSRLQTIAFLEAHVINVMTVIYGTELNASLN